MNKIRFLPIYYSFDLIGNMIESSNLIVMTKLWSDLLYSPDIKSSKIGINLYSDSFRIK